MFIPAILQLYIQQIININTSGWITGTSNIRNKISVDRFKTTTTVSSMHSNKAVSYNGTDCTIREFYQFLLGECMALWGKPDEPSIHLHLYVIYR